MASTVAVVRPHGNRTTLGMVTPVVSTRKQEKNMMITNFVTNLVIAELLNGRACPHVGLCRSENSLREGNEQTDTSR